MQLLLARWPEMRSLLNQVTETYVADTLGVVDTTDGRTLHRWVVSFVSPEVAKALLAGFRTAIAKDAETNNTSTVWVNGQSIVMEW
ncbi:MAG: hypothetical protein AAFY20_04960 [Cyanobacteria bacterium J06639_14]